MLVVAVAAMVVPCRAQAPQNGGECVAKMCTVFDGMAAIVESVSDPSQLEKAFEPLKPQMEAMEKEMEPYKDYVLTEEDKQNVSASLMNFMKALNKYMGAPEDALKQQVDQEVAKYKTLGDLVKDGPVK